MAMGGVQVPRTLLCVNVSHVGVLRTARGGREPDPVETARICAKVGCNSVAVRLRSDRRHIEERDIFGIRKAIPFNGKYYLEIALSDGIIDVARRLRPNRVIIVPEAREDMTAGGGLDVRKNMRSIGNVVEALDIEDIEVSLFVDPDPETIDLSRECGAKYVEINTAAYSKATDGNGIAEEIDRIYRACERASEIRIMANAGYGLNYENVTPLLHAKELLELNIGRAIISRSESIGLSGAVEEMMAILD